MALLVLRVIFVLVAAGVGGTIIQTDTLPQQAWVPWGVFFGVIALAFAVIGIDALVPRKQLDTISAVYFGMIIGLFLTYVLGLALSPLMSRMSLDSRGVQLVMA